MHFNKNPSTHDKMKRFEREKEKKKTNTFIGMNERFLDRCSKGEAIRTMHDFSDNDNARGSVGSDGWISKNSKARQQEHATDRPSLGLPLGLVAPSWPICFHQHTIQLAFAHRPVLLDWAGVRSQESADVLAQPCFSLYSVYTSCK